MLPVKSYMQRQIYRLAWPVILEMSGVMLVSVVVTAMVGRFGAASLASVGLATMVQFSSAMVFAAAGTGSAAIVAREVGAGNRDAVRTVTGQAIMLSAVFGTALALAGLAAAGPVFALIGADPEVAALASDLLRIMFIPTPVYLIMVVGNAILRGMGETRRAFLITTASNLIGLAASAAMAFGWVGPVLGAYGVAWGNVLYQIIGGVTVIAALAAHPRTRLRPQDLFRCDRGVIARILDISLPAAGEQLAMQGGRIVFTFMLASVGTVQFAAHQIAVQAESISFMPGFGFSVAVMTLTGIHLGRGLPHRAEQYVWLTNKMALVGMAAMGVIFLVFARPLTALFIDDPAVLHWSTLCVMIAALEQPTIAITYVLAGALRGAGDTRWPMYVTTLGVWVARIPLVYLLIVVFRCDITVAWLVTAADFLLRSIVLWRRFTGGTWRRAKNI
ncbi:MAG TPA: MATE family efflux transporter [Negativicutes bacterium]|nr:MATE family efflux transporter [Negativicutes bacterium]